MPLLPKKNSLDYNPDSTILASKKITNIALERMKNPLEDPDFATLSTLNAKRNLGDSVDRLEDLAGQFHSLVLRMGNLLLSGQGEQLTPDLISVGSGRKGRKKGGSNGDDPQEILRKIASKLRDRRVADDDDGHSALKNIVDVLRARRQAGADSDDEFSSSAPSASSSSLSSFDPRFSSSAPSASSSSLSSFDPRIIIDDDDNSTLPTYRTYGYDYDPNAPLVPEAKRAGEGQGATFNSLIFPLIQITRRMNMLLNSKIKPAIPSLSGSQVKRMNDIYQMVRTSYNDVVRPQNRRDFRMGFEGKKDPFTGAVYRPNAYLQQRFGDNSLEQQLIQYNQFGDEMLGTWDIERKNLLLNLTIVINSWKQNTPTGQQTEFPEDITRSFQNTAKRLGKKADLVEAEQQGLGDTDYAERLRESADALESVANPDILFDDASVETPAYEGISGLRQYDRQGNLIPYPEGAGRKPRGRPRKKDTMMMTMVGSGRNFYGEKIDDSRDIPTIWGSYKNCPTKYLL